MKEESGDRLDLPVVEAFGAREGTLHYVQHAHDHRRETGPLHPLACTVDLAAMLADPAQTRGSCVALGDCVSGDETEGPTLAHELESAPKEVSDEVCIAMAFLME